MFVLTCHKSNGEQITEVKDEVELHEVIGLDDVNDMLELCEIESGYWVRFDSNGPFCFTTGREEIVLHELVCDADPPEWKRHTLTLDKFLHGVLQQIAMKGPGVLQDYDSLDADCILQYALLGEIVYG